MESYYSWNDKRKKKKKQKARKRMYKEVKFPATQLKNNHPSMSQFSDNSKFW